MGAADTKLKGPDLAAGVTFDEIGDGKLLLGHAGGEAVVLTRRGEECFAIGASCTHYGGPLAEGVFDGECVRCPWHHAAFAVRTGDAVRAPALTPVAAWETAREGRLVRVTKKREPAAPPATAAPGVVVIVGGGAAGHACAERLRRDGHAGRIVLVSGEGSNPVDRPNLSKDYLAGSAPEEWMPLRGDDFYAEQRIELRKNTRVTAIEVAEKRVLVDGGEPVAWDALVRGTRWCWPPARSRCGWRSPAPSCPTSTRCARSPTAAPSSLPRAPGRRRW
jgi:apoptosis-inducing factor 3